MKKRLLAAFLCIVTVFSLIPSVAFADKENVLPNDTEQTETSSENTEEEETSIAEEKASDFSSDPTQDNCEIDDVDADISEQDESPSSEIIADAFEENLLEDPYEPNLITADILPLMTYISSSYSPAYTGCTYHTNLLSVKNSLSHDQLNDIIAVAFSQEGYHEGNNTSELDGQNRNGDGDYTEYGYWYNQSNIQWCAAFIGWCAYQAGIPESVIRYRASANAGALSPNLSYNTYNSSSIKRGDIICTGGTHVGLVYDVDSQYVYTIEGNWSSSVKRNKYVRSSGQNCYSPPVITSYFSPDYSRNWRMDGSYWYYIVDGVRYSGLHQINGVWYYFDETDPNHYMVTGWKAIGGHQHYFESSGAMAMGWTEIDGGWYFFDEASGIMQTGWLTRGSHKYYLGTDGKMYTGLKLVGSSWYYFWETTTTDHILGDMAKGWAKVRSYWYFFNETTGIMQTGWLTRNNYKYYLGTDGKMRTEWHIIGSYTYFFATAGGSFPEGAAVIDWVKDTIGDGFWHYFDLDGHLVTGWYTEDNHTYYLDPDNNHGAMAIGWKEIGSDIWYFFNDSGHRQTGWLLRYGYWYYLDPANSGRMVTGTKVINGITYNFDSSGKCLNP